MRLSNGCAAPVRMKTPAYWVCTLIDESDLLEAQAAQVTFDELSATLPDLRVGMVHGRMKPAEKQAVMAQFKAGELDLLVATTVIEVGVDVPNASLMIIENPERLGLAQLHQLRGRVGRGSAVSHCVLLYKTPLTQTAKLRLQVLRDSNDGFVIAQKDLEIRGRVNCSVHGRPVMRNLKSRIYCAIRACCRKYSVWHVICTRITRSRQKR